VAASRKQNLSDAAVIGFGLTVALLLVGGVLGYVNARRLDDNGRWVAHTHEVIGELEALLSTLKDAETGQRGYLLAEDEKYLQPYDDAVGKVQGQLAHLRELTSDNPDQQARLDVLGKKVAGRLEELRRTVALMKKGDRPAALKIVHGGIGMAHMDELRHDVAAMQQVERDLLQKRADESKGSYLTTVLSILFTALVGLVLVGVIFFLSQRNVRQRQRAAAVIAEQGERLQTTLASIGDGVISTDTKGHVTNMNAVAESLTGWKKEEATGQSLDTVFRIVNEETRRPVEDPALRALKEGVIVGLANHTVLIAKDGTERAIDDSAAPIRCKEGEVVGCVLVFRDITERRKVERRTQESERRKAAVIRASLDCIIKIDHKGRITEFNPAAEQTFGYRREDVMGRQMAELVIPPSLREQHRQGMAHYLATGEGPILDKRIEKTALRADGTEFPVELSVSRIPVDGPPLFAAFLRDITDRKQMQESERRLASVVESSDDAIISKSLDGIIESWNAAAERLFGYTAGQAVGRHISLLIPADRADEEDRIIASLRAGERVDHFETVRLRSDGRPVHVSLTISPIKDAAGRVVGASKIARDVTERKRLQEMEREAEHRLRFIMDSMPQKIFTAKPNGDVDYLNPVWTEFTGLSFEQIREWGWTQFIHPDDVQENVRVWKRSIDTGEKFHFEHRFRRADGEYRWHLSRALPMRDAEGQVVMWIGSNTDIHEQRRTANKLRQLAADLSEADRRKNEFMAMLAHELRNPLAPIKNAVQILRRGGDGRAVQAASEMMERQVGQMVRLVDDLLDVSRISRGKIELRKEGIELASAVNQAVEAARSLVHCMEHDLTVTLPPKPIFLSADPTRLAQVVGNLLNNACKFTDKGGRIWLTVEREGRQAMIRVRDSGIGIAADQLPRIFDMFMQVDNTLERSVSGLGIGLTLVKSLVEMHGGTVEVHSAGVGQGSEFVVRLPIMTEPAKVPPPEPTGSEPTPAKARRILVVDDNRDSAESLAMLLRLTGNETHTAYDGLEAVEAAARVKPDVALLDIGLPKLNGYEACRHIRELPWGKTIVLVALTGWGQEDDRRRSKEAGFDAHLVKPVDLDALMKLLAETQPTPNE
jgi:PAS domain S-box-containing protein